MARTSDPIETFAGFLAQAERSPLTIKNYRGDLAAFATWFDQVNGEAMAPAKVTPTDLRQFKHWLVEQRRLARRTDRSGRSLFTTQREKRRSLHASRVSKSSPR